jgi:N,N'-diacetyllegionaminate synthase
MAAEPGRGGATLIRVEIAGRTVAAGKALVIAEIGNNHDGSVHQAERLIDAAAEAGADAVKFQTHIAEAEMHPSTPTPPHFPEPRWEFTKRMELSRDAHVRLKEHAESLGLIFFSSPFSVEAVDLLEEIGNPCYKIASGEVTNPPLLEAVAATGKPVLLSTGMAGLEDVERALSILRDGNAGELLVLQCTSSYPASPEQVNLRAMVAMGERFGLPYGLSDHTPDVHTAIGAVALGAAAIEKHFTLSKRLYGPDHHASLTPEELARLVDGIRQVEAALGTAAKERDSALDPARATFEKSVVSRDAIEAGARIERTMLTTKRPGNGIPAVRLAEVVGRRAARPIPANHVLETADLA